MAGKLKICLKRSQIGHSQKQRKILKGLGLRRCHQVVEREDTPAIRGMIEKIAFMLEVEEL